MNQASLKTFVEEIKQSWGPLSSESVKNCREIFTKLASVPDFGKCLTDVLRDSIEEKELYRDPDYGFVLLAYTEKEGRYRIPHDHGSGWVFYAVLNGEMEMSTYYRAVDQKGHLHLVRRETYRVLPGDSRLYLPEDIHDTLCVSKSVLTLRLSSLDLKKEDQEGRMIRYPEQGAFITKKK